MERVVGYGRVFRFPFNAEHLYIIVCVCVWSVDVQKLNRKFPLIRLLAIYKYDKLITIMRCLLTRSSPTMNLKHKYITQSIYKVQYMVK